MSVFWLARIVSAFRYHFRLCCAAILLTSPCLHRRNCLQMTEDDAALYCESVTIHTTDLEVVGVPASLVGRAASLTIAKSFASQGGSSFHCERRWGAPRLPQRRGCQRRRGTIRWCVRERERQLVAFMALMVSATKLGCLFHRHDPRCAQGGAGCRRGPG